MSMRWLLIGCAVVVCALVAGSIGLADTRSSFTRPVPIDGVSTDVLAYVSEVLDQPLYIGGIPIVNLFASTSGTDSDWVVKVIDVYPDQLPSQPEMSGYHLGVTMRYLPRALSRRSRQPSAIPAGKVQRYRFALTG